MIAQNVHQQFLIEQCQQMILLLRNLGVEVVEMRNSQQRIETKINDIHFVLTTLKNQLSDLKNENRDTDQKISLMAVKLDKFGEIIRTENQEELNDYIKLSKDLFVYWDDLDDLTKKYIPVAEYLFSLLQKQPDMDFSPVVLEYCRAIENELLSKIFRKFALRMIENKPKELDMYLMNDLNNRDISVFAQNIKRAKKSLEPRFTLGEMQKILTFLKRDSLVKQSPLLSDFKLFLSSTLNIERLLDQSFLDKISNIVKNFRNKSAHIDFLNLDHATDCKNIVPPRIDYLIECVNN